MALISAMQTSFTGGEWAPSLFTRSDLAKYSTACRIMLNTLVHPHGPASNRAGDRYIAETKYSAKKSRLIPFEFSVIQTYNLEFGDQYMRVIKDGGQVLESDKTITGATQADPVVISSASHGYSNGDWVVITGVVGMTELNGKTFVVANAAAGTFSLKDVDGNDIDGTGYTAYVSGGVVNKVYEIATPYLEADIPLLKYEQSADVLYITHPDYEERKLTRSGHTAWTLDVVVFESAIDVPTGFNRTAGAGSGHTYAVTTVSEDGEESIISSSAAGGPSDTFGWNAVSGADYYNFYEEVNGIYGWLGSAGSNSYVVAEALDPDMEATPPKNKTPFSGAGNRPAVSAFYEQRLLRARSDNYPQSIWGSVTGSFENMNKSSPLRDDDAYKFTINARQVNEIRWMIPLRVLIIGTSGSIWIMKAGANAEAITYNNVNLERQNELGVSDVLPLIIGNSVLYVGKAGNKIGDLFYSLEEDGYKGNDLSILATHIFDNRTIVDWTYQAYPDSIVWAVRDDGVRAGLTYFREQQVWGWHRHTTQGLYESISSISTAAGQDDVYMIVKRIINGVTRRYIEQMAERLPDSNIYDAFFVDSGLTLDNPIDVTGITQADPGVVTAPAHGFSNGDLVELFDVTGMTEVNTKRYKAAGVTTNTFQITDSETGADIDTTGFTAYISGGVVRKAVTVITGLDHLEGMDVAVLANGSVVPGMTVANGSITLPEAASRVHVGLSFVSDLETMDFEFATDEGTVQDKIRNVKSVLLSFDNTRACWVGPDEDNLEEIAFRTDEAFGDPTRLFTGDKEVFIEDGEDLESRVFIRNVDPLPMTVSRIIGRVDYAAL